MQSHSGHTKLATLAAATIGHSLRRQLLLGAVALMAGIYVYGANAAESVLYTFCSLPGCADGQDPAGDLIKVGSTLDGTTIAGGLYGRGTAFSLTPCSLPPCTETVLHNFPDPSITNDGVLPYDALLRVGGWLYGTTLQGGQYGYGTIFRMHSNGSGYAVLHSFGSGTDGRFPFGSLIAIGGTLYGTTYEGGAGLVACGGSSCGTVFAYTPGSSTPYLPQYSFCSVSGCPDGSYLAARLVDVAGVLYGAAETGGAHGDGTVFSVTPCSIANACIGSVLYSFSGADGQYPRAGLIYDGGYLYGTTSAGGSSASCIGGCGTVFAMTTAGVVETWLYSFGTNIPDGATPYGDLHQVGAWLWGTTSAGGGQGTVFKIKASGLPIATESVVYPFSGSTDGGLPMDGLIKVGTELYGTTNQGGGSSFCGACGTLFEVN